MSGNSNVESADERLARLRAWLREQAKSADKSSHEWDPVWTGRNPQACYRSGMWWAYHTVQNFIAHERRS